MDNAADKNDGACQTAPAGDCTLREAIVAANATTGATVRLQAAGPFVLTDATGLGTLVIEHSMSILPDGSAAKRTIDGAGRVRVFDIRAGATVMMSNLRIAHGAAGEVSAGGGIENAGVLTLENVDVTENQAGVGAGVDNRGGTLTMHGGSLAGNTGNGIDAGGGLLSQPSFSDTGQTGTVGPVVLQGVLVQGNRSCDGGGLAVFGDAASEAVVTIDQSTVIDNQGATSPACPGVGGILAGNHSKVTITGSTIARNTSNGSGGILMDGGSRLVMTNSTLSGNRGQGFGGAIAAAGTSPPPSQSTAASATLNFVTIAGNQASTGGGLWNSESSEPIFTLSNSIVAGNTGKNCVASVRSNGYNLDDANDCGFTGTGDIRGANPNLSTLAANGGPTQTMALPAGSPAVNSANPQDCVATDQRGVARPQGPRCDIGAYELKIETPTTSTPVPAPPVTGGTEVSTWPILWIVLAALSLAGLAALGAAVVRTRGA